MGENQEFWNSKLRFHLAMKGSAVGTVAWHFSNYKRNSESLLSLWRLITKVYNSCIDCKKYDKDREISKIGDISNISNNKEIHRCEH